jgi:mannose-6-phosphate isomerase-like protein (cupin superfamily)
MKNENQNSIEQAPVFKRFRRVLLYSMFLIAAYLIVGYFLHLVVFPENKPNVSTYFTPGQVFYSKTEGFRQTVVKQENGFVYCSLEIEPYASGPPTHIHTSFDEYFEIESGVLSVWVDGEIKKIRPGETLHVPQGTPHRPFNDTADRIRLKGTHAFPGRFRV